MDTATHAGGLFRTEFVALSLFVLSVAPPLLFAGEDITGDWEVKIDRNGRETFASLSISKKPDGTYTGKWGSTELSDVKLEGNKLTFVRTVRFGDQEFKTSYEGNFKDGAIAGTVSSERGSFAANATRRKPRSPILGRWQFKYAVGDRQIESTLAVSEGQGGALEGKWTSTAGEHVVSNVKFQDGKLTLARKSKFGDRELETTYEGTLKENDLAGAIKSAELGEIQANGRRAGGELVGKWELTTTSERGTRTSMLTVFGDLTGRYELFGAEIPIQEIKLDGDQVSFSLEAAFGDQPFKMDFKGKLDGKTLKGELTTPRGTREVTGKKEADAAARTSL